MQLRKAILAQLEAMLFRCILAINDTSFDAFYLYNRAETN
jgi:hypothetical protein